MINSDLSAPKPENKITPFYIGDIIIESDLALAPMDGYTDSPFRRIAKSFGAGLLFTEFINAMDIISGHPLLHEKMKYHPEERPIGFQLFDNDLERILKAAIIVVKHYQPDFIDLNLGCPNRRVVSRGAGAALLQHPGKVRDIISALAKQLGVPVTAKIRLGPDENNKNFHEVARIIQDHGGQCLALHARTTRQGLTGKADWKAIAETKKILNIAVIGNGDVRTPEDIQNMKFSTGCDAVMIGRAAIGNPWIFAQLKKDDIDPEEIKSTILEHLELSLLHYGSDKGLLLFRKHTNRYVKGFNPPKTKLNKLLSCQNPKVFQSLILSL